MVIARLDKLFREVTEFGHNLQIRLTGLRD